MTLWREIGQAPIQKMGRTVRLSEKVSARYTDCLLGCIYQSGYTAFDSKMPTPSCQTILPSQMKNSVCKKGGDDVGSDQGCPEVCKPNGKFTVLVEIAQVQYNLYA